MNVLNLLLRARKVLTNQPGWRDDKECVELVAAIDKQFLGVALPEGRGAYDNA